VSEAGEEITVQQGEPVPVAEVGLGGLASNEVGDGSLLERRERSWVLLLLLDPVFQVAVHDGFVEQR
jgi:hypothetical protein